MRLIGHVVNPHDAKRFLDFLASEDIAAVAEPEPQGFGIWVKDENRVRAAVAELARFRESPHDVRYDQAQKKLELVRRKELARREVGSGKVVEMRERWRTPKTGQRPLTVALVALATICSVYTDFSQPKPDTFSQTIYDQLVFCTRADFEATGHDPLASVKRGQVWRLVTPIFLHGDIMHLGFNMIMLFQLGGLYEWRRGTVRFGLLTLGVAVVSCLCQALMPPSWGPNWGGTPFFVGMSGVVYGLFGYFWVRGLVDPRAEVRLAFSTEVIMLLWLFAGFTGVLSSGEVHVANWAHAGGLLGGAIAAVVPLLIGDLTKK